MQVFHVSPPSSFELASPGNAATAPDSADGFSQVLARQQSDQSAGAPPSAQASGSMPVPAPTDADRAASAVGTDDEVALDTPTKDPAEAAGSAVASPLADMVRELTARSRAVAAGSLERSLAAHAGGKAVDPATFERLDRETGTLAEDGSAPDEPVAVLDPAFANLEAAGAAKPATKRGDAPDDARLPFRESTALVTPDAEARTSLAALRSPSANAATGTLLSGQSASSASSASIKPGTLRDLKPNLSADAWQGLDLGLTARRGDATASANALMLDGKSLSGKSADPLFGTLLPGGQPDAATAVLNPVSMMAPPVTGLTPGMATSTSIVTGSIPAPVGSPQWAPAFSEQLVQIGTRQGGTLHHAELRLDPPDLGPLRVTISMQGEQATATFVSPHASVRTAVEAALPQLMQALADAGISLGDTSVGEQDAREFAAENTRRGAGRDTGDTEDGHASAQAVVHTRPRGLIDTFA